VLIVIKEKLRALVTGNRGSECETVARVGASLGISRGESNVPIAIFFSFRGGTTGMSIIPLHRAALLHIRLSYSPLQMYPAVQGVHLLNTDLGGGG
jgi:hypothetical protein